MQGMGLDAVVSEEQQALSQRNISSEDADPLPIGRVEPMSPDLIWPGHPSMMTSSLFTIDLEPSPLRLISRKGGDCFTRISWKESLTPPPIHQTIYRD